MATSDQILNAATECNAALDETAALLRTLAEGMGNAPQKNKTATVTAEWTFEESPKVPKPAKGDNSAKAAPTSFVKEAVDEASKDFVKIKGAQDVEGVKNFKENPLTAIPSDPDAGSGQSVYPIVTIKDYIRAEIEKVSNGRLTVIRDVNGNPHVMVRIPRFRIEDYNSALGTGTHPMFLIGSKTATEVLLAKYKLSVAKTGYQSIAGAFPWVSMNFDTALAACRALGPGFALNTQLNANGRNLLLLKEFGDDHVYHGNTNYGRCHAALNETGTLKNSDKLPGDTGFGDAATALGSGGLAWTDNGRIDGLDDWTGCVWEWTGGFRVNNGELQALENNNGMLSTSDMSASSSEWKAFLQSGSYVTPGSAGTLKYDSTVDRDASSWTNAGGVPSLNTERTHVTSRWAYNMCHLKDLAAASGVTVPAILKLLGVMPMSAGLQGAFWITNDGERLPFRGGVWTNGATAGPSALHLAHPRSNVAWGLGCRAAFVSYAA